MIFGTILTPALIIFASLPAAITIGHLQTEILCGHLDILATLPGLTRLHSILAWLASSGYWILFNAASSFAYFQLVLRGSDPWVPTLALLLLGIALGPLSVYMTTMVKKPDTAVLCVPLLAFITCLPGLLYFEVAFDIQRHVFYECLLCLLFPASAVALVLRMCFASEALNRSISWYSTLPLSSLQMRHVLCFLVLDVALLLLGLLVVYRHRPQAQYRIVTSNERQKPRQKPRQKRVGTVQPFQISRRRDGYDEIADVAVEEGDCESELDMNAVEETDQKVNRWSMLNCLQPFFLFCCCRRMTSFRYTSMSSAHQDEEIDEAERDVDVYMDIRQVKKTYRASRTDDDVIVLSNIRASLIRDEVTVLLGSNGAGKTTLMKILAGMDTHFTGSVTLRTPLPVTLPSPPNNSMANNCSDGHRSSVDDTCSNTCARSPSIAESNVHHRDTGSGDKEVDNHRKSSKLQRQQRSLGWCPQSEIVFPFLTVQEHVAFVYDLLDHSLEAVPKEEREAEIAKVLDEVDLLAHRHKTVDMLSGGMKRRLTFALSLMHDPQVLILDEPTSGCDSHTRECLRRVLLKRKSRTAILLSTHHADDVDVLASRVWFLNDCHLEVNASAQEVIRHHHLQQPQIQQQQYHRTEVSNDEIKRCEEIEEVLFSTSEAEVVRKVEAWAAERGIQLQPANRFDTLNDTRANTAGVRNSSVSSCTDTGAANWSVLLSSRHFEAFVDLLARLEAEDKVAAWKVTHQTVFQAICSRYDSTASRTTADATFSAPAISSTGDQNDTNPSIVSNGTNTNVINNHSNSCILGLLVGIQDSTLRIYAVIRIRLIECSSRGYTLLLAHIVLPFFVIFVLAIVCKDIRYPKILLESATTWRGGVGEIPLADLRGSLTIRDHNSSDINSASSINSTNSVMRHVKRLTMSSFDKMQRQGKHIHHTSKAAYVPLLVRDEDTVAKEEPTTPEASSWTSLFASYFPQVQLSLQGAISSDALFDRLFQSYYAHSAHRWAALAVHDVLEHWVETTVFVPLSVFYRDSEETGGAQDGEDQEDRDQQMRRAFNTTTSALHRRLCGERQADLNSTDSSYDGLGESNENNEVSSVSNDGMAQGNSLRFDFCSSSSTKRTRGSDPVSYRLQLVTLPHSNVTYLQLSHYIALETDVTLLSNVTTDHAAPVFLKEMLPTLEQIVSSSLGGSDLKNAEELHDASSHHSMSSPKTSSTASSVFSPVYSLYSYPLPETNLVSKVSLERGSLGAIITLLYLLLSTVPSVRFLAKMRATGVKRQFHLSGLTLSEYYFAQWSVDVCVLCLSFVAIYAAIYLGGDPLRRFFFVDTASFDGADATASSSFVSGIGTNSIRSRMSSSVVRVFGASGGTSSGSDPPIHVDGDSRYTGRSFVRLLLAFAFAIVPAGYAYVVLSEDALVNQLVMLITTVCGTIILKMYLDRHRHISPYAEFAQLSMYVSPAYAFTSGIFEMFAIFSDNLLHQSGDGGKGNEQDGWLQRRYEHLAEVETCLYVQGLVFLLIVWCVDGYWVRWQHQVMAWWWRWSAALQMSSLMATEEECIEMQLLSTDPHRPHPPNPLMQSCPDKLRDRHERSSSSFALEKSIYKRGLASGSTEITSIAAEIDVVNATAGPRLVRRMQILLADDWRIGVFPVVTPSGYALATELQRQQEQQQMQRKAERSEERQSLLSRPDVEQGNQDLSTDPRPAVLVAHDLCVGPLMAPASNFASNSYTAASRLSLANLNFTIYEGDRVAVMGMNGGGKTTFFETLAFAQRIPVAGSLQLCQRDAIDDLWALHRHPRVMGYVPQEGGLLEYLSVRDTLWMQCKLLGVSWDEAITLSSDEQPLINGILPARYLRFLVQQLSGGTRKKLQVCLANLKRPAVLVLDECTTGVDPIAAESIVHYLSMQRHQSRRHHPHRLERQSSVEDEQLQSHEQLLQERPNERLQSVLFSSHRIDECLRLCDRVLILVEGQRYLDAPLDVFAQALGDYYQVDLFLHPAPLAHRNTTDSTGHDSGRAGCNESLSIADQLRRRLFRLGRHHHRHHHRHHQHRHVSGRQPTGSDRVDGNSGGCFAGSYDSLVSSAVFGDTGDDLGGGFGGEEEGGGIERFVEYSASQWRVTCHRRQVPLSRMWRALLRWQRRGWIARYAFREMDMEEALSTILASARARR